MMSMLSFLRQARIGADLSQAEAASRIGVQRSTIQNWGIGIIVFQ